MPYDEDRDTGLDHLLQLHGVIQVLNEHGYWAKFEVRRVAHTALRPHGIKYSLTLHSEDGTRLMGFDNAHSVDDRRTNVRDLACDHHHRHARDGGVPYEFATAWQLLQDFYTEVDRILKKEAP